MASPTHQSEAHPPDQELTCSGCFKVFTRCGSLVQHIEIDGCPVFRKQAFEKIRDANDDYYKKVGAKKPTAATTTDIVDKAHTIGGRVPAKVPEVSPAPAGPIKPEVEKTFQAPTSRVQSEIPKACLPPPSRAPPRDMLTDFECARREADYEEFKKSFPALNIQKRGQGLTDKVSTPKKPTDMNSPMKGRAEVDLIEMSPNRVLKLTWSSPTGMSIFNNAARGTGNNSVRNENVPWGKEAPEISPPPARPLKSLGPVTNHSSAPSQPSNLRSPTITHAGLELGALSKPPDILQPLQGLTLGETRPAAHGSESTPERPAPKYYHKYDPDKPGFSLEEYRNPYSKKYKCAFAGCTKLLNSAEGLYMHLKSNAHLTDLYSCPFCFKQFNSAAAITQHLESQTNRCNARDDRRFNQLINQVAAGMIDAAGTHDDNTHRYYSAQIVPKLQLDTVHEANEEVIVNAVHDPEYRSARVKEREQKLKEEQARVEAWQNDDWAE
ncbi:hypothetical protein VE03_09215 [Pseudogymnoascus sp. 23342-1-I1]|nr:hypothetical protein VE03_09215 [Pseudogymnoascus sp. 23342-1-I1]